MTSRVLLSAVFSAACTFESPLVGPAFTEGALTLPPDQPVVVALTYARPARGQNKTFQAHVGAIATQLDHAPGLLGYSFRSRVPGRDNWTMSLWESEAAMLDFMAGGAHVDAMASAGEILEDSAFTHWTTAPDRLPPDWEESLTRLESR
jgi:quinol monooxygenase YgiN